MKWINPVASTTQTNFQKFMSKNGNDERERIMKMRKQKEKKCTRDWKQVNDIWEKTMNETQGIEWIMEKRLYY